MCVSVATEAVVSPVCVPRLDFVLGIDNCISAVVGLRNCRGRHYLFHIIGNLLSKRITPYFSFAKFIAQLNPLSGGLLVCGPAARGAGLYFLQVARGGSQRTV